MNNFYLIGKLIEEPEKSQTGSGLPMAKLRICVDKSGRDSEEDNNVFEVTAFRSIAEMNIPKGAIVVVSGKVQPNNYSKEGTVYYNTRLVASAVSLIA